MLPGDVVGTQIYNPREGTYTVKKGPVFGNFILADEINRAPAKVQSALLEAMQERQVTLGDQTFKLAEPFLVLATQNPIEQEGTYPLPEAQLDRFMLKVKVGYPTQATTRSRSSIAWPAPAPSRRASKVMTSDEILAARDVVAPGVRRRQGQALRGRPGGGDARSEGRRASPQLAPLIDNGASPRASIALDQGRQGAGAARRAAATSRRTT